MTPTTPSERFWAKVSRGADDECWLWQASAKPNGYGQFGHGLAHRFAYEDARGPIPAGLVIDHLCQRRRCVNPTHLEAVPQSVNVKRGYAGAVRAAENKRRSRERTHCKNGHELTPENTYVTPTEGWRQCRTCKSGWGQARYRQEKAEG
jgi:hypothetical protein